jgi:hypothetical protein
VRIKNSVKEYFFNKFGPIKERLNSKFKKVFQGIEGPPAD